MAIDPEMAAMSELEAVAEEFIRRTAIDALREALALGGPADVNDSVFYLRDGDLVHAARPTDPIFDARIALHLRAQIVLFTFNLGDHLVFAMSMPDGFNRAWRCPFRPAERFIGEPELLDDDLEPVVVH